MLTSLLAHGELIRDGLLDDISLADALGDLQHLPYFDAAFRLLLVQNAANLTTGSTLDYYNFASHSPAPFAYPVNDTLLLPSGFGNLIKRPSSGLQYVLKAPVTKIDYSVNPVVVIVSGNRTFMARKVIVTASTGVLAANPAVTTFNPVLPAKYVDAIKGLPMGHIYKAGLALKKNIFAGHQDVKSDKMRSLVQLVGHPALSVFVNDFGAPAALFIAQTELADALENRQKPARQHSCSIYWRRIFLGRRANSPARS